MHDVNMYAVFNVRVRQRLLKSELGLPGYPSRAKPTAYLCAAEDFAGGRALAPRLDGSSPPVAYDCPTRWKFKPDLGADLSHQYRRLPHH